jgi:hypothetical protein
MSNNGVPIPDIAGTIGHRSTYVTETAIRGGASIIDDVFGDEDPAADEA